MTKTSFRNMLRSSDIATIEIPIIQRDFAQGRQNIEVKRIRRSFLDVLKQALTGDEEISLDFVYGDTKDGRFIPLDGQQRLTSLYLLHWYLAVRCRVSDEERDFIKRFTYHTRFSSRDFCAKLATICPGVNDHRISEWLQDQHWFAGSWRKDPTIQSMLVVLDDIQALFAEVGDEACHIAWNRLTSEVNPSITFEILSLEEMGLTDELYIKMNSRGKPLTEFEHFKAQFEQVLKEFEEALPATSEQAGRYAKFARKIDQDWADLIWPFRGANDNADEEFLRLFRFITDITIWRHGLEARPADEDLETTAKAIYGGPETEVALAAQKRLFSVLDGLHAEFAFATTMGDIDNWFRTLFANDEHRAGTVTIFGDVNLLDDCCRSYGLSQGRNRAFSLSRTLLLHAVVEYIVSDIRPSWDEISERMRCLRNVIFASQNEIRVEIFPALLDEVSDYIVSGDLAALKSFNRAQVEEEVAKSSFLLANRSVELDESMYRLEDHDLLRGNLAMFDLNVDERVFIRRARAFDAIFSGKTSYEEISQALLACGDYSQKIAGDRFQFASPSLPSVWRDLFVARSRPGVDNTKATLTKLLDGVHDKGLVDVEATLRQISEDYLREAVASKKYDWRYYMTKYPAMRSGKSGIFISSSYEMGFDLCMMEQTRLSSYYSDPYVRAVLELAGVSHDQHFAVWHYGYAGYEADSRWSLYSSNNRHFLRVTQAGFEIKSGRKSRIQTILDGHGVDGDGSLNVRQSTIAGIVFDRKDRVVIAADLVREIVKGVD
ncbi:DUF262 domain-containing protein [Rhizobium sp. RMa-01]|uniref:DUF262 domain-containing protein n=1 Tax=unclassified Rhizobium TaxID=2613769 RepID=UPI0008DA8F8C|nr:MULTISPECIES: DUF262 domain-containing protein [unclassified Rhizobium]OHV22689.1 hypothetical protein BBJ66_29110 [Rhizobium sp. RSm-3]RVU05538.1 DUF262 domain-containing protein [Rhizobium sp. RMa-01]